MNRTRVTVIDDDRDVLDLFHDLLMEFGCEVEMFADALPGLEQLIASRPDLIIVDLRLAPRREQLTGAQVIHSARTSTELRNVPVVVCSAATAAFHEAWPDLMERGDIQQLEKPFDIATFQRVVETALGIEHGSLGTRHAVQVLADDERDEGKGEV